MRELRERTAFAPCHVTGLFAPAGAGDPRGRGSVGAGIVLSSGVYARARFRRKGRSTVRVVHDCRGRLPITFDVARRLLDGSSGLLEVELRHELPIGQGFGTSAAGALATALAVSSVLRRPRERAIEVAHLADLFGGGGLGGVAAILGGGLEVRRRPGVPPWGRVTHRPFSPTVWLVLLGRPVPSPRILRDASTMNRIRDAGAEELAKLGRAPSPTNLLAACERFTDRVGLLPSRYLELLRGIRALPAHAAQAMFGSTLFAVPPDAAARDSLARFLERRRLSAFEVPAAISGATLLPRGPSARAP